MRRAPCWRRQHDAPRPRAPPPPVIIAADKMLTALIAALAAREQDDLAREHANLADQLRERKEQRQNHLKRARSALVGNDNEEAVQAFSKAIELSVARTHGDALILAASDRWKPADLQRVELADMYTGRGLARLRMQSWADAVKDAHAAAFLAANRSDGGGHDALSLLGAASAGLCSLPQEPAVFFSESDDAGESKETPEAMTERLFHGLVADVYSMMADGLEEGSAEHRAALTSRDGHVRQSHGALHPLAERGAALTSADAFTLISMAVESLAAEPFNTRTNTPKVALLAQTLISITAFRLGCREPPLQWRPKHLLGHFRMDRVIEVWLRSRVEGELAGPAFRVGQLVGLTGLSSRPELNGELGKVVAYDKLKDRFKVVVAGKRLGLRASNLVAVESGGEAPEGEAKSEL